MVLFLVFFGIGTASLSASILCDDLLQYYRNRHLLKAAEQYLERLESLNTDYDLLLRQLEKDPNLVKRIAPAALGIEPEDANAIYPRATAEQLAAARKALEEDQGNRQDEPCPTLGGVPKWLSRCSEPRRRITLFLAGTGLILISLICFGPAKQAQQTPK